MEILPIHLFKLLFDCVSYNEVRSCLKAQGFAADRLILIHLRYSWYFFGIKEDDDDTDANPSEGDD